MVDTIIFDNSYTEQDLLDVIFKQTLKYNQVFFDNVVYDDDRVSGLHIPINSNAEYGWQRIKNLNFNVPHFYHWIFKRASFFRKTLLDENLPLECELLGKAKEYMYQGGRRVFAEFLLDIRYHPAMPEFREMLLHDKDYRMQAIAAEALGSMGNRARLYVLDICRCLNNQDNEPFVRQKAASALGNIVDETYNSTVGVILRDTCEDMIWKINHDSGDDSYGSDAMKYGWLLHDSLEALFKIDFYSAREIFAKVIIDDNFLANHYSKMAVFGNMSKNEYRKMKNDVQFLVNCCRF